MHGELPYGYDGFCSDLRPVPEVEELGSHQIIQAIMDIAQGFRVMRKCHMEIEANKTYGSQFHSRGKWMEDLAFFRNGNTIDVFLIFALAAAWTVVRAISMRKIFRPLSIRLGVQPENAHKFAESAYKATTNLAMWLMLVYISFFRGHNIFFDSFNVFADWRPRYLHLDLKIGYYAEFSYYVHAVFATLFMETRRKDTAVMLLHHFVTLALISFSYIIGYLKIGILILVLDDISDVLLEIGKAASYLRNTKSGYSRVADAVSQLAALLFAVSWFVCRVVFHLTKVWRAASLGSASRTAVLPVPFFFYFNILVGCLYFFYIYWFWFIVSMVLSLVTGKRSMSSGVQDTREYDEKAKKTD